MDEGSIEICKTICTDILVIAAFHHELYIYLYGNASTAATYLIAKHDLKNSLHVLQQTQFWSIYENFSSFFSIFGSIS